MKNIGNLFVRLFVVSLLAFRYFSTIVSLFGAGAAPFFTAPAPAPAPNKQFRRLRLRLRPKYVGSGGSGSGSASLRATGQLNICIGARLATLTNQGLANHGPPFRESKCCFDAFSMGGERVPILFIKLWSEPLEPLLPAQGSVQEST